MHGPSSALRARAARRGFTLLELMIVVAIIAIVAAIAIPNLLAARMQANESAAVAVLRTISTAQAQFQLAARADEDANGFGEYGGFGELTGAVTVRGGPHTTVQLTRSMSLLDANGEVSRNGYIYRMYLPAIGGAGLRETGGGGYPPATVDASLAETIWICYAYPARYGSSGTQTYFMSSHTSALRTEVAAYELANCALLRAGAALLGPDPDAVTGRPAIGQTGADGNPWKQVQ